MDMPDLTGTDKQRQFAGDIRANTIAKIPQTLRDAGAKDEDMPDCTDAFLAGIAAITDSVFWIENRTLIDGTGVSCVARYHAYVGITRLRQNDDFCRAYQVRIDQLRAKQG